ncbi:hypothetical protein [Antarcticirhabdus aurantiaca]|uniref:Uncharacterized protein n=1 Tax=Antarcticirhabdus aurantiaca TaxID=2606717 RepID=A0ACD4NL17_9HYPH|nr:hypothetical protein OXU80_22310 [Jeongeuplla avenae]
MAVKKQSGAVPTEGETVVKESGGADTAPATQTSSEAAENEGDKPADIPAATEFEASGAPHQIVPDVDPSHPAVDDNPRAHTTVDQNRIDFNDPTISGAEAVAKALNEQGVQTKTPGEAEG